MAFVETSNHLFQPPKYKSKTKYFDDYNSALKHASETVNIDIGAIQSYLSFGYICGNRTLLKEVERQPWLSKIVNNEAILSQVPEHGFYTEDYNTLADIFFKLLLDEMREVIKDFDDIYVLLSGGLDSRIAAGVLKFLYNNGELKSVPKAVSWGLKDSRDVVYAQEIAKILEFEWIHVPLTPELVIKNIHVTSKELGLLHSPEMLHSMLWFKNLPKKSLVIAGSFGDSIGRAEFSNLHLLQLKHPKPLDKFNILQPTARDIGQQIVSEDIDNLFQRTPDAKSFAHYEHFMQGYRMRGGLCNALSVINGNAKIYQIFTAPKVYEFIWSLHPSIRGNEIYIKLFERHLPKLSQFPWARTNKALGGKTKGAIKGLRLHYHEYTKWSKNELRSELETLIDFDWFKSLNLFDMQSLDILRTIIRTSEVRVGRANDIWFWLAGFRVFMDHLSDINKSVVKLNFSDPIPQKQSEHKTSLKEKLNHNVLNKSALVNSMSKDLRTHYRTYETKKLKKRLLEKYPPKPLNRDLFL
ncbi:asparagine synthase-related protein [uncultured Winogradskyella sp.]|uniref:asparagine synthase-related protein n=1 Tax=uncultured Winogradskyella sp. TaxID=395353 RepID=UPI002639F4B0|nr:asparagine synthase-related protein [uncultured Winogradskyella sp.]